MSDSATRQWTLVLVLTALFLSLVVLGQIVARYGAAYWAAPREIASLLDSADSSLQENESYDRDVAKVPRRDDKIRLGLLLREIQRAGDDLREDLNSVLVGGGEEEQQQYDHHHHSHRRSDSDSSTRRRTTNEKLIARSTSAGSSSSSDRIVPSPRLKTTARVLWAAKRTRLEERLRRLDLLRMRFLVVYMSIVAATATAAAEKVEKTATVAATASAAASAAGSTDGGSATHSAAPSMPASPRDSNKAASIVAASIAAAAKAAAAAGATDSVHYPFSPDGAPRTPPILSHPFFRNQEPANSPGLPGDLAEGIRRKPPPLRRVSTSARPIDASPEGNHRAGWMGVVQELQRSPLLHKRHTSIEMSMARR